MKIKKLTIKNFKAIGEAELNLYDIGLVLINGVNDTDTSSSSNGAGKSTIIEAISWCLFGETAKSLGANDVVNNKVGKNCAVEIIAEIEGVVYNITRHRKCAGIADGLYVARGADELTKGTTALTQELLNELIGCNYDIFKAVVYSGQDAMVDLPGMSDKFLKAVVEDAAGLDKLQSASDIAIAKNKAQSEQVVLCLKRRDGAMIAVELLENDLQKEKERAAGKKAADEERRAEVYKQLFEVVEEIKAMPALLGEDKLKRLENNKAKIDSQIKTAQGDEKEKLWQMQQTEKSLQSLKDVANVNLTHATAKVDKLQRNLDLINSRIGQPCGECGKTYHAEDIEAVAEKERGLVEVAKSQREALEADVKRAETAINDAVAARKSFEASMTDVSDLLSVRAKIDKLINNEKHNAQLKQEKEKAVARLNKDIESIEEKITKDDFEFQKYSADQLEEIDMAKCNLKVANEALEAAEKQLELTAAAVEVFGRAGVRGFILDTVTPFLNERTAQYLGALTDGNITANWTTLSKTAKGEIREKFTIDVEKKDGAKTFAGLSGGEKRKVRLSTAFALQDLVASRATKPIGFQFLDEIDTALDSAGVERLMGILEERGREKGTILVVSHNDLKSYITNSITVTNKGGIAKVTLETE